MVRPRPYIFCRYGLFVDEEVLDAQGQLNALQELQGNYFAHGPTAEREGRYDTVIMRPHSLEIGGETALIWSVGQKTEYRFGVQYDQTNDSLDFVTINDGTVRYNDFVAIPRLGVMAVDDRTGESHINAKGAIARFRSVFRNVEGGAANVEMTITSEDVTEALSTWELREISFKVRPVNPHSRSDLSRQLSDALEKEGMGTFRASARPKAGGDMRPNEGILDQAHSLSDEGYGQIGVRGVMDDGHVGYIPRPQFEEERQRNERIQEKPRQLKVYIETDGEADQESFQNAAQALVNFYER